MNQRNIQLAIVIVILAFPLRIFSQAGTLDDTYGTDGIAIFSPSSLHEVAQDVIMLSDTSSIICGSAMFSSSFDGFLMHILPDGSQDMAFGTNGIVQIDYGDETYAYSLELQPDGKIVVAGLTYTVLPNSDFFIARYYQDGTPDLTFNSTGYYITSYSTNEENLSSIAMQADGKFVLAGQTNLGGNQLLFTRINTNGTLDNSFGTNGYTAINASPEGESINGVKIMNNGDIVGVGYGMQQAPLWGEQVFMAKLTSSGAPAPGFGINGVLIPAVFNDVSIANDLVIDNDSLYLTGYMYDASNNWQLFIAKLNPAGASYSGFGTNGISFLYLNPLNVGYEIIRTGDKKLYISGTTGQGGTGNRDFLLARYLPSGELDDAFDADGYVITAIRPDWDEANALAMQPDGKVVLSGMTSGFSTTGNNDIAMTRYLNDFQPSGLYANFSANTLTTCEGATVQYTDMSFSTDSVVLTWNWTFEGGSPASSAAQNPVVTYANDGIYDVRLIVYDGIYIDTLLRQDYISVESLPAQPGTPSGTSILCGTYTGNFTTSSVAYADSYEWQVNPSAAGTITGNGLTAAFTASATWTGTCSIQARGTGFCGTGPWSLAASCIVSHNPFLFQLTGEGGYCTGDPGSELVLDGSEIGVDYELYLDGIATGNILTGSGSALSFGFISETGLYSTSGFTAGCFEFMVGQVYVHQMPAPEQANTPVGPDHGCDRQTSVYTTETIDDADVYIWTLSPDGSGELTPVADTAYIEWAEGFTGSATLSVHAENICGEGPESEPTEITVSLSPDPAIIGNDLVCSDYEEKYETAYNNGSFYTWEVTGGVIVDGAGTYQATVLWGAPGAGIVTVTEEITQGCSTTTESFDVIIEICEVISENSGEIIIVYPNPAKEILNVIISNASDFGPVQAMILNAFGQVVGTIDPGESTGRFQICVSGYPAGVYTLELKNREGNRVISRFVVTKI